MVQPCSAIGKKQENVLTDTISLLFAQWMCHSKTLSNKMVWQMDLAEEPALSVHLVVQKNL